MQLRIIDKKRYQKHYKILFVAIVTTLIVISLACSTLLIALFSTPDEPHFMFNLAGVVIAAIFTSYSLFRLRHHPFMEEVVYVWNLKKQLNRIYRKQHKIEPLIDENNTNAMVVMNYMYLGSKQLYELDNNTITMSDLMIKINHLNTKAEEKNLPLTTDDYHPDMLKQF